MVRILLDALSAIVDRLGWFFLGTERQKRKAAERDVQALQERDRIQDEISKDTDSQLVDRLSNRDGL